MMHTACDTARSCIDRPAMKQRAQEAVVSAGMVMLPTDVTACDNSGRNGILATMHGLDSSFKHTIFVWVRVLSTNILACAASQHLRLHCSCFGGIAKHLISYTAFVVCC